MSSKILSDEQLSDMFKVVDPDVPEVCVWKPRASWQYSDAWEGTCEYFWIFYASPNPSETAGWTFCPSCGRKIEVEVL